MGRVVSALNSILFRVFALILVMMLLALVASNLLMQTPLAERMFDRAIQENSKSIVQLVWVLENSSDQAQEAVLATYASRSRVAVIRGQFPTFVEPDAARAATLTKNDAIGALGLDDRTVLFRDLGLFEMRDLALRGKRPDLMATSAAVIAIELESGRVLEVWLIPSILYTSGPNALPFLLGLVCTFTIILGFALHWVIMRPIRALESEAELVGLAETSKSVTERGPREQRRLSAALNRMRHRLAGLVSAVSASLHRSPLSDCFQTPSGGVMLLPLPGFRAKAVCNTGDKEHAVCPAGDIEFGGAGCSCSGRSLAVAA